MMDIKKLIGSEHSMFELMVEVSNLKLDEESK